MYFSLPKNIPPHPLGGTKVRKDWSAVIYMVITLYTALYIYYSMWYMYARTDISINKHIYRVQFRVTMVD